MLEEEKKGSDLERKKRRKNMALDLQGLVLRQASEGETDGIVRPRVWHDVGVTNRDGRKTVPISKLDSFLPTLII